eukprot:TRINITY_DN3174_c0_g1_i2.p1 TRINITY_DN3174_c0_g1~~TRINITY_DN3174_c0_g1_i2.p1  ORF type:complete len:237 (-),score=28.37 TRINITY_DN3174_c0_g1_i2:116-826(-)
MSPRLLIPRVAQERMVLSNFVGRNTLLFFRAFGALFSIFSILFNLKLWGDSFGWSMAHFSYWGLTFSAIFFILAVYEMTIGKKTKSGSWISGIAFTSLHCALCFGFLSAFVFWLAIYPTRPIGFYSDPLRLIGTLLLHGVVYVIVGVELIIGQVPFDPAFKPPLIASGVIYAIQNFLVVISVNQPLYNVLTWRDYRSAILVVVAYVAFMGQFHCGKLIASLARSIGSALNKRAKSQ